MANTATGLFAALRHLAANLADVGRTRLALLSNEIEEGKIRLASALAWAVLALSCLIIGVVSGLVFLTLLFWESRLLVLGAFTSFFIVAAFFLGWQSRRQLTQKPPLFEASIAELETDIARLREEAKHESTAP